MTVNNSQVNNFMKTSVVSLTKCLKSSLDLPVRGNSEDTVFHEFPQYKKVLNGLSLKVLNNIQQLIDKEDGKGNLLDTTEKKGLEDKFNILVEVNDRLLDKCNSIIYSMENPDAKPTQQLVVIEYANPTPSTLTDGAGKMTAKQTIKLLSSLTVERPQAKFTKLPDNSKIPFRPLLTKKPNAKQPLSESLINSSEIDYPHPYLVELDSFTVPTRQFMVNPDPEFPKSLVETRYEYVETQEQLEKMMDILRNEKEISIDLEHHNRRTYLGITCLIQISTRNVDFVIDTISGIRDRLEILNEVFTDPQILKVFHGSSSDLMWLQRDFGVYVVNMFDTGLACEILNFPRKSLSFLLEKYCGVQANKEYQRLTDWRMRPLIAELIEYARTDTHYLLYIYDRLCRELSDRNHLEGAFSASHRLCYRLYAKPVCDLEECMELYRKSSENFNPRQLYALKRLWELRDNIAREEDESVHFVFPNRVLLTIAQVLPRETSGVLACCSEDWKMTMIRKYVYDIQKICLESYNESLTGGDKVVPVKQNVLDFLLSKHDRTKTNDDSLEIPIETSYPYSVQAQEQCLIRNYQTQSSLAGTQCIVRYLKHNPLEIKCNSVLAESTDQTMETENLEIGDDSSSDVEVFKLEESEVSMEINNIINNNQIKNNNIDTTPQPPKRKSDTEKPSAVIRLPKEPRVVEAGFDYQASIDKFKHQSKNTNNKKQFQPFVTKKFKKFQNQKKN